MAVLGISVLALGVWVARPAWLGTAALMLITGAAQATRLGRWAGDRTLRDRLVLILHIGYAFVPIGFVVLAAAALFPEAVPISAGIHAWTVGAIGTMTLVHHDACQSRPYRPATDCRAADAKHLRRGCDRRHPSHRGNPTARRNDSASTCRGRRLDRGVLDVCRWLWSAAVAKAENRASIARHCPALSLAVHPAQLTFENLL